MRKFALLLGLVFSPVLAGQTTVVSGTIADPNGIPYTGASVTALLVLNGAGVTGQPVVTVNNQQQCISAGQGSAPCKLPFPGSIGPFTLDNAGSFTITLQDNVQVTPAGTQWQFNVTTIGVALPFGTGPQSCTGTATITGVSQSVSGIFLCPALTHAVSPSPGGQPGQAQVNNNGALGGTICETFPSLVTGPINIDCDPNFKGPNPYVDIMRFGGYFEPIASPVTTTGNISSGSATLTIAAPQNFANNQGIVVQRAGLTPTARNASFPSAPTVGTVTPLNVSNGATTYTYCFVLEDYFGGLTPCGSTGSTTTGAATLGVTTVSLTGIVRSSGVDTFACSGNCNVFTNSLAQISGFASSLVNGTVVVASTPDATHFTVNAQGQPDYSESASGTLSVRACNAVIPSGLLSQESVILRVWNYRNGTLSGVAPGQDPFYIDCNQGVTAPAYVPTSAPASAQSGYLATTISAGGGTTTLTLANAAGSTVTGATVQHDNSQPLLAAWAFAYASHGSIVKIPVIPGGLNAFPFNATTDLTTPANPQAGTVKLLVSQMQLSQPVILSTFSEIEGLPQTSTSFQYSPIGIIGGPAQPLLLANHNSRGGITISKIKFSPSGIGASSIVLDQTTGSGGEVGFIFNDNGYSSNNASAIVIKGGFDFWFTHGNCGVGGTENGQWFAHPCLELTNGSAYLNATGGQIPGRVKLYDINFNGGTAIQQDNYPSMNQNGIFVTGTLNLTASGLLHESFTGPTFRIALGVGTSQAAGGGLDLSDVVTADPANGLHEPLIELTGSTGFNDIILKNNKTAGGQSAINGGGLGASPICLNNTFVGCGVTTNQILNGAFSINDGGIYGLINGGSLGYLMATPAAPASCVVSAGGSVPVTTGLLYQIAFTDRTPVSFTPYSGITVLGPACSVNTTLGNQTVTVTRPAPASGASGWLVWRGTLGGTGEATMPGSCTTPIPISTTTFVDTLSFGCGTSQAQQTSAFTSGIDSTGLNTGNITISGESVTASPRAEQSIFLPGALTATWTGSTWIADRAITVTRVQVQAKTAPVGCATNAIVRLTDGTTPINITVSAAANDSGAISQAYAGGASLTVAVQTAAAGCGTSPSDANVVVQYKMQ